MRERRDCRNRQSGFTLVEMIIVMALFSMMALGLLGMLLTVYRNTNSTEFTVSYKTEQDRVRNFIANTVRQNQWVIPADSHNPAADAVDVYGADGSHMSVKLADGSGYYIHFLIQDKTLYMYVGSEVRKNSLTSDEIENRAMVLGRDMKSVKFEITTDAATGNRLLHITQINQRQVYDSKAGGMANKEVEFNYQINIYTR